MSWYVFTNAWVPVYNAPSIHLTYRKVAGGFARTSDEYTVASSQQGVASVAIDFPWPVQPIPVAGGGKGVFSDSALLLSTHLRTRPGLAPVSVTFAVWDLNANVSDFVPFTATDTWEPLSIAVQRRTKGGNVKLRAEIYILTAGQDLLIDRLAVS